MRKKKIKQTNKQKKIPVAFLIALSIYIYIYIYIVFYNALNENVNTASELKRIQIFEYFFLISLRRRILWVLIRRRSASNEYHNISFLLRTKKNINKNTLSGALVFRRRSHILRKHGYSNTMNILPPNDENFQIKKFWYFSYFCSKHRLRVLVRTASMRWF